MMTCGYFGIIQCISRTITEREEKIAMEAALAEEMAKAENADDDDLINELSEDIDSNIDVDKSYIETYEEDEIPSEESVENEFIYEENLKTESSEDEEEVDDNLYKY